MDEELRIIDVVKILKKRWITVLLTILIMTGSVLYITQFVMSPIYVATIQVILAPQESKSTNSKSLIQSYIDIVNGDVVLERVKRNLGLKQSVKELQAQIIPTNNENSQVINIKVESHNPKAAAQLARQVVKTSLEETGQYFKVTTLQIIDEKEIKKSTELLFPKPLLISIISMIVSLLGGISLALLKEQQSYTQRHTKGISRRGIRSV